MIEKGSKVHLHYTLTVDGDVVGSSRGEDPLAYIQGEGHIVPGLEEALLGKKAGDQLDVAVPPDKGYGMPDDEARQSVPKSAFEDPSDLKPGDVVSGEAGGQPIRALVLEVTDDEITLDLNHPLAGKTLQFAIEVVEVE